MKVMTKQLNSLDVEVENNEGENRVIGAEDERRRVTRSGCTLYCRRVHLKCQSYRCTESYGQVQILVGKSTAT